MKKLFIVLVLTAASLVPVFAGGTKDQSSGSGTTQSAAPAAYTVTVAGSTSVSPLMELLIAEYAKVRPNVRFNMSATGSGDGIKAVPAETAEIGMSSRELSPAEIGTGIDEHLIAIDGIAV
ncbi:MAG: substrate-binding domain-containing protein, partial [Treponema sp.]|nr:substrate-binding domain-containing protein [Treponema sp.]